MISTSFRICTIDKATDKVDIMTIFGWHSRTGCINFYTLC